MPCQNKLTSGLPCGTDCIYCAEECARAEAMFVETRAARELLRLATDNPCRDLLAAVEHDEAAIMVGFVELHGQLAEAVAWAERAAVEAAVMRAALVSRIEHLERNRFRDPGEEHLELSAALASDAGAKVLRVIEAAVALVKAGEKFAEEMIALNVRTSTPEMDKLHDALRDAGLIGETK